jgi:hypothetical protein
MHAPAFRLAALFLVAFAPMALAATPEATVDTKDRAAALARTFYDWYLEAGKERSLHDVLREKKALLAPDLYRALKAARELEFDPFTGAQDVAYKYELGEAKETNGRYHVPVFGFWEDPGSPARRLDVTAEIGCTATDCRFENFHYAERRDLLGTLRPAADPPAKR